MKSLIVAVGYIRKVIAMASQFIVSMAQAYNGFFHRDQAMLTNCQMKKVYVESMYNGLNMRASLCYLIVPRLVNNFLFVLIG